MSVSRIAENIQPLWNWAGTASSIRLPKANPSVRRYLITSADVVSFVLDPAALAAFSLGLWRLGADLNWTGSFFIGNGLFSHWQVWLALAVSAKLIRFSLRRTLDRRVPARIQIRP